MSRWSEFRTSSESWPSTPFEAAVFLQNARLHLVTLDPGDMEGRRLITDAHAEINKHYFNKEAA